MAGTAMDEKDTDNLDSTEYRDNKPEQRRRWLNRRRLFLFLGIFALGTALVLGLSLHAHSTVMDAAKGRIYRLEEAPVADVALVFGARVSESGDVSWPLRWRLQTASDLYKEGRVRRILVSGDNRWTSYNEPLVMKRWLMDNGVPENRIACDYAGRRTLDSCARANRLWGIEDKVILVSQSYHLPRALFLAKSWGMDALAVPADRGTFRRDLIRERIARVKAWLDVNILKMEPAVWGPRERWPDDAVPQ